MFLAVARSSWCSYDVCLSRDLAGCSTGVRGLDKVGRARAPAGGGVIPLGVGTLVVVTTLGGCCGIVVVVVVGSGLLTSKGAEGT